MDGNLLRFGWPDTETMPAELWWVTVYMLCAEQVGLANLEEQLQKMDDATPEGQEKLKETWGQTPEALVQAQAMEAWALEHGFG